MGLPVRGVGRERSLRQGRRRWWRPHATPVPVKMAAGIAAIAAVNSGRLGDGGGLVRPRVAFPSPPSSSPAGSSLRRRWCAMRSMRRSVQCDQWVLSSYNCWLETKAHERIVLLHLHSDCIHYLSSAPLPRASENL
eukprot:scaffold2344_cov102-Phaeocystis_antarctica.AAC.1